MKIDKKNLEEIRRLCSALRVKRLAAFGSVTREDYRDDSDIDLLVDFEEDDPFTYTDLYFDLKEALESLFARKVDLIEERGIRNSYFREEVDATKVPIYG